MSRKKELDRSAATFGSLAVKTPGIEAPILSLSGGNQQKVVMARALLSEPGLIVADEPTQGVDVGARFEIYRILREVSSSGTPVIVNSSDAAELEGLVRQGRRPVARPCGGDARQATMSPKHASSPQPSERSTAWRASSFDGGTGYAAAGLAALSAVGQCASRSAWRS